MSAPAPTELCISADSHITEPPGTYIDRIVGGPNIGRAAKGELLIVPDDLETVLPDGLQVGSPGDEGNLMAVPGQHAAKVASDAASAHHSYPHGLCPIVP